MTTDPTVRSAFIHGALTVALAFAAMVAGVAAHGNARTILLALCPLITLIGTIVAGVRTYRAWKARGRWPVYQGLLWFLMMTTLLLFMSVAPAVLGFVEDA